MRGRERERSRKMSRDALDARTIFKKIWSALGSPLGFFRRGGDPLKKRILHHSPLPLKAAKNSR